MEYEWTRDVEEGQRALGFVEVYRATMTNQGFPVSVMVIVRYLPVLPSLNNQALASLTVFWRCDPLALTDGFTHWVMHDVEEHIRANLDTKFLPLEGEVVRPLEFVAVEFFLVRELPELQYRSHGDWAIIDARSQ